MSGFSPRGPLVLPGTYTIRLIVGDQSVDERRIIVSVDPTVPVTAAALQEQFDLSTRLQESISNVNAALRSLDGVRDQLQQIERNIRNHAPNTAKEIPSLVSEQLKAVDAMIEKLAAPPAEGLGYRGASRIADQLSSLFSTIQGANAAPTPAMKENFAEVLPEAARLAAEAKRLLDEKIPALNESLRKAGLPTVIL
jgi:hypothetical protein